MLSPAVWFIVCLLLGQRGHVEGRQVAVRNDRQLKAALKDSSVERIKLTSDILLRQQWTGAQIRINRDVILEGDSQNRLLNMSSSRDALTISINKTLTLYNMSIWSGTDDASEALQLVGNSPGAHVDVVGTHMWQVCREWGVTREVAASHQHHRTSGKQELYVNNNRVRWYKDVLLLTSHGYLIHYRDSAKLCRAVVNETCLRDGDLADCVDPADGGPGPMRVMGGEGDEGGREGPSTRKLIILMASLMPTTGMVAVVAVVLLVVRHRRSKRKKAAKSKEAHLANIYSGTMSPKGLLCPPGITLGKLLGSGAYGQVYEGTWDKRRVAIKIISSRGQDMLSRVTNETKLSTSFDHPNVVRSHFYTTSVRTDAFDQCPAVSESRKRSTRRDLRHILSMGWSSMENTPMSGQHPMQMMADVENAINGPTPPVFDRSTSRSELLGEGHQPSNPASVFGMLSAVSEAPSLPCSLSVETWIVQELCDLGPLTRALTGHMFKEGGALGYTNMLYVLLRALDVARGMRYLHSLHVCHGDLKPENVLLVRDPEDPMGCSAKVADFGISRALTEGKSHLSTQTLGTVTHMSPELLIHGRMSPQGDVYSFGILMWELLSGRVAYHGLSAGKVIQLVVVEHCRPHFEEPRGGPGVSSSILSQYHQLARDCWHEDKSKRPGFKEVVLRLEAMLEVVMKSLGLPGSHEHSLPAPTTSCERIARSNTDEWQK